MAFNKAPSISTHQTKDIKLVWALDNREASKTKDSIAKNGVFDLTKQPATKDDSYTFIKREGVSPYMADLPEDNIRGMYYWEDSDKLYVAYEDKIAIYAGTTGVLSTTLTPFTSTTGDVGFTEFYFEDGSTNVVVSDGVVLAKIDNADTLTASADADLPSPHNPHILFLDGYLFIIKSDTSDIYNSTLNDPLAWVPGDFLTAEMIPDTLFRIARLSNYLIAMGSASIEYFFDAGNASGSPLQRNDTPIKHVGFVGGFASHENKIFFVGQASNTAPAVYVLEDFKMETIESPMLRRHLQKDTTYVASLVSMGGHVFYVLTIEDTTFALDIETKVWTRFGFQDTDKLPCRFSVMIPLTADGHCSVFSMSGRENLFYFRPEYYLDDGETFPVICQTPKLRFDSLHEKYMSRLLPVVDKTVGTLMVDWSDDDYQTYTTPRPLDLSLEKPILHRMGRFVERALRFTLESSAAFRMYYAEVDYNIGLK